MYFFEFLSKDKIIFILHKYLSDFTTMCLRTLPLLFHPF